MQEKLAIIEPDLVAPAEDIGPHQAYLAGRAGDAGCPRCVAELTEAGRDFDQTFSDRDFERFVGYFANDNITGLGADGTIGMNRGAWSRILREYFDEASQWKFTITPIKVVVQNCVSGQILEVAHFDSPEAQITFIHASCWVRDHGEWKVVLQTEAGPIQDTEAVLAKAAALAQPDAAPSDGGELAGGS